MNIFPKKPFLIAEIGVNYYDIATAKNISNIDAAKLMIKEAKNAGADAVKFQSYKADTIASKNSPAYWDISEEPTSSQYELFKKFDSFGKEEYEELSEYCKELGIIFLSTPFDFDSIEYLDEIMNFYKISSSDLTNIPFIKAIAKKQKPVILSTGASTLEEIKTAIKTIEEEGNNKIGIMHCVLSYPTNYEDANLLMIKNLKEIFPNYDIGFSDHTKPDNSMLILTTAYFYGANIIEKHFTLDKTLKGNDHYHAMDPNDIEKFKDNISLIKKINGQFMKEPLKCEETARKQARRSIVTTTNIAIGEIITKNMLTFKRPGTGISPVKLNSILGKVAKIAIKADQLIEQHMVDNKPIENNIPQIKYTSIEQSIQKNKDIKTETIEIEEDEIEEDTQKNKPTKTKTPQTKEDQIKQDTQKNKPTKTKPPQKDELAEQDMPEYKNIISKALAKEFNIDTKQSENIIKLINDGNTIPFISSYRKEFTKSLNYDSLQKFSERLNYLKKLEKRKKEVIESIKNKEKLTDEIKKIIDESETLIEIDDIYNQYVEEKETKIESSKKKSLSKFANIIRFQQTKIPIEEIAKDFISKEKGINTVEEAISGSLDIIAGIIADNADFRYLIRKITLEEGKIVTEPTNNEESSVYEIYYDHIENIHNIASHKILAINRGESEGFLKVKIVAPKDEIISYLNRHTLIDRSDNHSQDYNKLTKKYIEKAILNSYERLIAPSIEKEIREYLTNRSEDKSIEVFSNNLEHLLMQSPTKNKVILGWYPSLYVSSKLAVLDKEGKVLETAIVNPLGSETNIVETKETVLDLIKKYNIDIIALGDIQDSKELEQIIANIIQGTHIKYALINQAGASAYSSSALAEIEFPNIDKGYRTAISIARRLQDPLVEFVKVDPKTIGVGQYQHDMNQKKLNKSLANVIEKVVNNVGVDLNTASISLLNYVSGIDSAIATDIVRYREENGPFKSRDELLKLDSIDSDIFKQAAGFLKVYSSDNPLDKTSIHPESYEVAKKLLEKLGYKLDDLFLEDFSIENLNIKNLSNDLNISEEAVKDIAIQLKNPKIDPRENMHKPILRSDTLLIEDLKEKMVMEGMIRNVVDFGAFVDIGVHHDGLIHISKMGKGSFVKHPSDIVSVGDIVKVKILEVDLNKKRIQLTLC